MLATTALGFSTVWVGAFDEAEVMKVVGILGSLRPLVLLPIGYAEMPPRITSRRSLEDLAHYLGD
ncbi:MAG: hypothetical protein A2X25_04210 [Chloroflexi bacterium GWB2_49_20]|nr:MAG: hypothetical protein A2X25_04210 [Chloroflexi bacterium GWB2_49_20]OGN77888.1 MAG: hypothetical protein A2X26_02000 [Chloroflexi bacterium GWC2_49_37]OGN82731.1 MAG: hypothetical protein A2X27_09030 [Chloroflexi bacterium GWD2_49_16]HCM96125.1 hypothetical protein [Anaerolineae bacterium]